MYSLKLLLKLEPSIIEDAPFQLQFVHSFRPVQQEEQDKFTIPQSWVCALGNIVAMSSVPGIGSIMALQKDPHGYSRWTNEVQMITDSFYCFGITDLHCNNSTFTLLRCL